MTDTTKTIFEKFEVRKTKKQKTDFIHWIRSVAENNEYEVTVEKGLFGARNIIIGDPIAAKVVYAAHYDTCAVLPFPNLITPRNLFVYLLYQLVLSLALITIWFVLTLLLFMVSIPYALQITTGLIWVMIAFMLLGPANKHTANDNTSGVTAVIDIMQRMPEDLKRSTAYILFDLEEAGMWGSLSYRLKHNKTIKEKLLLNFDCISDGTDILITIKKKAKQYIPKLKKAFIDSEKYSVEIVWKGVFCPSDHEVFPCGVGIAAFKRTKLFGILYLNRIHTKKDTIYQEENIRFLTEGAITLAREMKNDYFFVDEVYI